MTPVLYAEKEGSNPVGDAGPEITNGLGAFLYVLLPSPASAGLLIQRLSSVSDGLPVNR